MSEKLEIKKPIETEGRDWKKYMWLWQSSGGEKIRYNNEDVDIVKAHFMYIQDLLAFIQSRTGGKKDSPIRAISVMGSTLKGYVSLESDLDVVVYYNDEQSVENFGFYDMVDLFEQSQKESDKPIFSIDQIAIYDLDNIDVAIGGSQNGIKEDGAELLTPLACQIYMKDVAIRLFFPGVGDMKKLRDRVRKYFMENKEIDRVVLIMLRNDLISHLSMGDDKLRKRLFNNPENREDYDSFIQTRNSSAIERFGVMYFGDKYKIADL